MDEGKSIKYLRKYLHVSPETVHRIRNLYLSGGELALLEPQHKSQLSPENKEEIIKDIQINGLSLLGGTRKYGIANTTLRRWMRLYKAEGIAGLERKRHRPVMKKKRQRTEAELDELEILRRRNEYLEAENALLKKVKALVEARDARLRETGQKPSTN